MRSMRDRLMCQYATCTIACCKVMCCCQFIIKNQTKLFQTGVWTDGRMRMYAFGTA